MPRRFEGKVVFITGAARGQGRSHAVRFAQEGADIIATDICAPVETPDYPMATAEDLAETARMVEALDQRVVTAQADVRDTSQLDAAVSAGLAEFERIDVVVANAGIGHYGPALMLTDAQWNDIVDINLTGVFKTLRATLPSMIERGIAGSAVITSSAMGIKPSPHVSHYAATKSGLTGLCRSLAIEVAPHNIRVNTVNPTAVDSDMFQNDTLKGLFVPGEEAPTREQFVAAASTMHILDVPWIQPDDVSSAVLYLASDEARYITGVALPVDAGFSIK